MAVDDSDDLANNLLNFSAVQIQKGITDLESKEGNDRLQEMALIKISRLSVQPVKKEEFDIILDKANR